MLVYDIYERSHIKELKFQNERSPSRCRPIPYSDARALLSSTHPLKVVKTSHSLLPTTCRIL